MHKHIQTTFHVKCSRSSLSRRMRDMGFTRGIIRQGCRFSEQPVPELSAANYARLLADPSPGEELMNLPGNSKKAKYAWLVEGEQLLGTKKPRKKRMSKAEAQAQRDARESYRPAADRVDTVPQSNIAEADAPSDDGDTMVASQYPDLALNGFARSIPQISQDEYMPSYMSPCQHNFSGIVK